MKSMCLCAMAAATVAAQHHHHDPFEGSNCTCDTFCANKCAINATKPEVLTLYRMTPFGVWDMKNKNTGDFQGDTSFVLSRKTTAYQCREDPDNFMCQGVTQFKGDDPNSTDVIQEYKIEVDGQWGPYLYCNPKNISDANGTWACTVSLDHSPPAPPQCQATNYEVFEGYCIRGKGTPVPVDSEGGCCTAASKADAEHFEYNSISGNCTLFKGFFIHYEHCSHGVVGRHTDEQPPCNCTRVHKTVGRENLTSIYGGKSKSYYPAGGVWYSHPEEGRCTGKQQIGDGSGCTWRVIERTRTIKASCMYKQLDEGVESTNQGCFTACPQPRNVTSDCYLHCYYEAVSRMTSEELAKPWKQAFKSTITSEGGCPDTPDM